MAAPRACRDRGLVAARCKVGAQVAQRATGEVEARLVFVREAPPAMSPVTDEHLPALFRAADRSSFVAQRRYLGFVWANLVLIVVGSVATSLGVASRDLRALLWLLGAAALVTGLGLTVFLLQLKPDEQWFGARAIAESVKTIAWLYMTRAGPYRSCSPDHQRRRPVLPRSRGHPPRAPDDRRRRGQLGECGGGDHAAHA